MFFLPKLLDAMPHPLAETDRHAWIAIHNRIEILAGNFQEHRIVERANVGPVRLAAEQWHFAKTVAVAVRREDPIPSALQPRVGLQPARNDHIQGVARVILAHHEVALLDRDKFRTLRQTLHQLFAETGQNWHAFKYLEFVLHAVVPVIDPSTSSEPSCSLRSWLKVKQAVGRINGQPLDSQAVR